MKSQIVSRIFHERNFSRGLFSKYAHKQMTIGADLDRVFSNKRFHKQACRVSDSKVEQNKNSLSLVCETISSSHSTHSYQTEFSHFGRVFTRGQFKLLTFPMLSCYLTFLSGKKIAFPFSRQLFKPRYCCRYVKSWTWKFRTQSERPIRSNNRIQTIEPITARNSSACTRVICRGLLAQRALGTRSPRAPSLFDLRVRGKG